MPKTKKTNSATNSPVKPNKSIAKKSSSSKAEIEESNDGIARSTTFVTGPAPLRDATQGLPVEMVRAKSEHLNDGLDPSNPARIYVDGIFDMFHYGHARALKQAKNLFPYVHLIVGVCNDELTMKYKGKVVMTDKERAESLRHCRYVDEVLENAPWFCDQKFLDMHDIDYLAHGNDEAVYDGNDCYAFAKKLGRFKYFNRTEGVSTSDLILRIIRSYDEYVNRQFKRGYSRSDLNVGILKEQQIKASNKAKEIKESIEKHPFIEFLARFGERLESWAADSDEKLC